MDSQVYTILERYYRNECSAEEVRLLIGHFNTASEQDLMNYIMKGFELEKREMNYDGADKETLDAVYRNLEERIRQNKAHNTIARESRPLWPRYIGAAAAAAAIVFGIWFYNTSRHLEGSGATRNLLNSAKNDIAPGHNGATLTFASGKTINLSDKKNGVIVGDDLRYDDHTLVIQSNPLSSRANAKDPDPSEVGMTGKQRDDKVGEIIAQTTKGQLYSIILQDGTKAWLNSASKLSFSSKFGKTAQRIVEISGEVYFEVVKDARRPFIVRSHGQEVTVLGTHFNVKAYSDEPAIRTTLLEGSVRLSRHLEGSAATRDLSYRREDAVLLKPGQQATNTGTAIKVEAVNAADAIAWKSGRFAFNRTSLEAVLREMGRWYNVDIKYPDGIPDEQFTGNINRNNTLAQALDILKFMKVKFEIQGRTIIVKK
ncbi:FecR family protein [Pedobacter africanus]|uniref:FecR family protein n=1 Tax=Pedobacter africanus TaxID=151894 RepID=A0A1W2AZM0_9SPHI|nr:FecR family protein [Pedobacter africanus]SMC66159.1 FecR family protein [Pedobacter africanus]